MDRRSLGFIFDVPRTSLRMLPDKTYAQESKANKKEAKFHRNNDILFHTSSKLFSRF